MTREEAIEVLKNNGEYDRYYISEVKDKSQEAVDIAIKALSAEPCDCISRKEAIKAMEDKAKGLKNLDTINGLCGAVAILYDLPSVQPIRPKGKWIEGKFTNDDIRYNDHSYKCNRCGEIFSRTYDFCVCGADMRGETNG